MRSKMAISSFTVMLAVLAVTSQADIITWNGLGDGTSWNDGANWGGSAPTSADDAVIKANGANVNVSGSSVATKLDLADVAAFATSTLNVQSGGTLTLGSGVNYFGANQGTANINVEGNLTAGGVTYLGRGAGGNGTLTVSGNGVFANSSAALTVGSNGGTSVLNVIGSSADVSFYRWTMGNGTVTANLTLGSAGFNSIDIDTALDLSVAGSGTDTLNIDVSGYDIANGSTVTLFTYGSIAGAWDATNITWGALSGDLVVGSKSIQLVNVIPEPATIGLLGIGAILTLLLRRVRA